MNERENTNIQRVLEALGDQIIDVYRRKLYEGGTNATGLLGNSLSCIVKTEDGIYDLYLTLQDYWKYVENGRQPGKFPPMDVIKQWIQVKPVIPDARTGKLPTIDQLTFLISRSIAINGIQPKNYLENTLREFEYDPQFYEAISKDIEGNIDLIFKDF
jgi:hypothetical protein